jgi:hypothetical protein
VRKMLMLVDREEISRGLADSIRRHRRLNNLTQEDLAEKAGSAPDVHCQRGAVQDRSEPTCPLEARGNLPRQGQGPV